MRRIVVTALMVVLVAGGVVHAAKFRSAWKAPDAGRLNFAGKKVAAVVITDDQDLQVAAEEELAGELTALGVLVCPPTGSSRARRSATRPGQGVVRAVRRRGPRRDAGRVGGQGNHLHAGPVVDDMYANPWDYYAYGWGTAIGGVNRREDLVVTIETLVYNVPLGKLVWAGVSEKTNPKVREGRAGPCQGVVSEIRKGGLVPKGTP